MNDIRSKIKSINNPVKDVVKEEVSGELSSDKKEVPESDNKKKDLVKPSSEKKRRVGRPAVSHRNTKVSKILKKRGLTRRGLYKLVLSKYPDEPLSPDAVSRIVSGSRVHYSTKTLYRICGALGVTPNDVLDYEKDMDLK